MGQGIFKISNLRKTYYYLKKNGFKSAYYAALERIMSEKGAPYRYEPPKEEHLAEQRASNGKYPYRFSILVPAYETKAEHLREMVESVLGQSYDNLELIIADASRSGQVREIVETYKDNRIRYLSLEENGGISENTGHALKAAAGDYIGLLDHDDVLTPDALYEMAAAIHEKEKEGNTPWLLYSDEDKGNGELTEFYEPHFKPELNVDLLLSNNYICHFMVMKRELMQELGFRTAYDGAQDYDLVLRAVGKLLYGAEGDRKTQTAGRKAVVHVPKVLYHWRCHELSTAENPESKRYAYEAGKRALEDFLRARGWQGTVSHMKHLGFYRIDYGRDIFAQREEVGVVAGRLLNSRKRICGGAFDKRGRILYAGLHKNFSGYMHRAVLKQEVCAADIRRMRVRKELWAAFEEIFGVPYREDGDGWFVDTCTEIRDGIRARNGIREQEGSMARDGIREQEGSMARDGIRAQEGSMARDGIREQEGSMARDGIREQEGSMARNGIWEQEGSMARDGIRAQDRIKARDGSRTLTGAGAGRTGRQRRLPGTGISRERRKQCMEFGRRVRREGYTVVWTPEDAGRKENGIWSGKAGKKKKRNSGIQGIGTVNGSMRNNRI